MEHYDFAKLYRPTPEELLHGIEQDTEHWLAARRGRITASDRAHKLLYSRDKTLNTMMDQMAIELITPVGEGFSNRATEHGHAFEEQAIDEYDMLRFSLGDIVKTPGMFVSSVYDIASATPDFFEGSDTTGQIKCPFKLKNHLNLLHFGCRMVSANYYTQVQFESFITQRPNIVFVSYHPDAPSTNQVHIEEITRCEKTHDKFRARLTEINHLLVNDERFDVKENSNPLDGIPDLF